MDDIDEEAMGFLDLLDDDMNDNKSELLLENNTDINTSQIDDNKSENNVLIYKHDSSNNSAIGLTPTYGDKKNVSNKLKVIDIDGRNSKNNESKSVTNMSDDDQDNNEEKSERS
jgi:hypothetical protein